jgi:hypothetical protein
MAEPRFADDDDLPRTLKRERDARERELREREMAMGAAPEPAYQAAGAYPAAGATASAPYPAGGYAPDPYGYEPAPAGNGTVTVTRLQIPFLHLVAFSLKAVIAAIPALVLMGLLFWGAGEALRAAFPSFKGIHIRVWDAPMPAETIVPPVPVKKR